MHISIEIQINYINLLIHLLKYLFIGLVLVYLFEDLG